MPKGHFRMLAPREDMEFVLAADGRELWRENYSPGKQQHFEFAEEIVTIPMGGSPSIYMAFAQSCRRIRSMTSSSGAQRATGNFVGAAVESL